MTAISIPVEWDTGITWQPITPYRPSGWICPGCGRWCPAYEQHSCPGRPYPNVPTVYVKPLEVKMTDPELDLAEDLVKALEKLDDLYEKGDVDPLLAYIAARTGWRIEISS